MTDIKEIIGITELLTECAYIKKLKGDGWEKQTFYRLGQLHLISDYSEWLNKTKLTPELVENLFNVTKVSKSSNPLIEVRFYIKGKFNIEFYKTYQLEGETIQKIEAFTIKPNGWETEESKFIQTLADLARLTADSPIPLA